MRWYVVEFNRCIGDNIYRLAEKLRRLGFSVLVLKHKTTLKIGRPRSIDWTRFKEIMRATIQKRHGSLFLCSKTTGNTFICSNRGNRPGRFVPC